MGFWSDLTGKTAKKEAKKSRQLQETMMGEWSKLHVPTEEELKLVMPDYTFGEEMTPEMVQTFLQRSSEMENISIDPALQQAQTDTLAEYQAIADDPSLSGIDKAKLYEILQAQRTETRGARDAVVQSAAQRGIGGSGIELVNQMMANQAGADRAGAGGYQLAGQAEQRRLDALSNVGRMSGEMRDQSFGEQADVARAKDMISKFNVQQRTGADEANVIARNKAQSDNIAMREREAIVNQKAAEDEAKRKADIAGMIYEMESGKLTGRSTGANQVSRARQAYGDAASQGAKDVVGAIGTVGETGAAMYTASDVRMKDNIAPINDEEAREMLGNLTGYKYEYKDEFKDQYGDGPQMGVMAQDMEKSEMGAQMVEEGPDGKMIGYDPSSMTALLAHLNERLEKVENT